MSFWTWALDVYGRPGAPEACLELQDSHRQSIPYLLWAAWAAAQGRALGLETLRSGSLLATQWETSTVTHLRAARRGLKIETPGIPDGAREGLRAEVKAVELEAEKVLMTALEALAPAPSGPAAPMQAALEAAIGAWAFPAPYAAIERLATALA